MCDILLWKQDLTRVKEASRRKEIVNAKNSSESKSKSIEGQKLDNFEKVALASIKTVSLSSGLRG